MAGPRPQDTYDPNNSVAPAGPVNDYLNVRSNPNEFGAQVGEATQRLGSTLGQAGQQAMDVAIQSQGLANEHAANMAEQQLAIQGGDIYEKYKSLEGLDAANAKDKAVGDYIGLSNKIRDSLGNPAAQRAYDQIATRRLSFTIQEMNGYAAQQTQKAYRDGNSSLAKLAIDEAGKYGVATNPSQLSFQEGTILHAANTLFTAPGYGLFQTLPVTQGKDGRLDFGDSEQGRVAQAKYNEYVNEQVGQMYSNAVKIMAFNNDPDHPGSVAKAADFLVANKDKIPTKAYASLSAELHGPLQNEQTHAVTAEVEQEFKGLYDQTGPNEHGISYPTNMGNVTIHGKEFANPTTPLDGVILAANNLKNPIYNGKTLEQIAPIWTKTNPQDWLHNIIATSNGALTKDSVVDASNPVFLNQFLRGLAVAEKSPDDRKVYTPQLISQGVEAAIQGKQAQLSPGLAPTIQGGIQPSFADYMSIREPEAIQKTRDRLASLGYDQTVQDMGAQKMAGRISEIRSYQAGEVHTLRNQILQKVMDDKSPITSVAALDQAQDPNLKQAWVRLQSLDYYGSLAVQSRIRANAQGRSSTYGTDFYTHLDEVLNSKLTTDQLQDYFGGDKSPISTTGVRVLEQIQEDMKSPNGQGFAAAMSGFLKNARGTITGASVMPGINPEVLAPKFNKQLMSLLPQIEAKRKDMMEKGLDPIDMFNPASKDYVGKSIIAPSEAEITKAMSSSIFTNPGSIGGQGAIPGTAATTVSGVPSTVQARLPQPALDISSYATPEALGEAWKAGKIKASPKQISEAITKRFGAFAPEVPKVH